VASASYDAANELTQWGGTSLTYDANGNLTGDGLNIYAWNARNQLASINGGIYSFQYDAFGRRVANSGTAFLYDGVNPAQELTGSLPTANLLTGLGVDEVFSRTDALGARHFLTDGLGSTLALTDTSGAVQTQYTYEPFGNTSSSGLPSGNTFQYTGRQNDATGLYYYRARYYSPVYQRLISEDPIGLTGGINRYVYAINSPANFRDPTGKQAGTAVGCVVGGPVGCAVGVGVDTLIDLGLAIAAGALGITAASEDVANAISHAMSDADAPPDSEPQSVPQNPPDTAHKKPPKDPDDPDDPTDPNKLHHIFDNPAHNLDQLVDQLGGQQQAFDALQNAVQGQGLPDGLFNTVVNVGGIDVTVTGNVINGVANIGTAYVP
jgi:RHS repeat-associated protein